MITWSPIFHFYQPPTQDSDITKQIVDSTYRPFFQLIKENPSLRLTVNITGSLTLQLNELNMVDVIESVKTLAASGQIEFVRSPIYHPIIPLIPDDVTLRQLEYNTGVIEYYYGADPLSIVLPPELAIDETKLSLLADRYKHCLVDSTSLTTKNNLTDYCGIGIIRSDNDLTNFLRAYPSELNVNKFHDFIEKHYPNSQTIISVNDVELFGHHYEERLELFRDLVHSDWISIKPLSEVIALEQHNEVNELNDVVASSWTTTLNDKADETPFRLWRNPKSALQMQYWNLIDLAYKNLHDTPQPINDEGLRFSSAQKHFDKGVSSCHLYWLSNWPWWNPEIVEEGAKQLISCIRSLPRSQEEKIKAEALYSVFIKDLWTYHWSGKPEEQYEKYDEYYQEFKKSMSLS
ncbi:hypothetical protein KC614_03445 [candidate division WWE3 bacterium]|uniref:Glycoside hydrolase family 57 N-terminal domain-containing protein n=1 Tax=candidate division WWE3 bacterium TaxID=2053526 RepID=A0A955RS57_UNCKA|nr:hypothetical protein [candidate division WWE3 bacterium]MCA9397778.1 hypothetical protein [candidate division WWE3 bacterium]